MKGIILAGGYGTRLKPLTNLTNKHLIPVYKQPMILYPINTLKNAGVKDIMIITGPEYAGDFLKLLGSGKDYNLNFTYKVQDSAGGIAQALGMAENFAKGDSVAVILGDNVYEDNFEFNNFTEGAKIFLKEVPDPNRFGVAEINEDKVLNIEEKPENPKTNLAVTGLYLFDSKVFDIIKTLKPSHRGELEITDVNNAYIQENKMSFSKVNGFWSDAGTFPSLHKTIDFIKNKEEKA